MLNNHYNLTFLSNKYSKCYYNIISKALQADRIKVSRSNKNFVYYESHHIIPKSIRPEFKDLKLNPWNKVLLTPKEHFICHLLLTKMLIGTDKNKMIYALWGMTNQASQYQGKRFKSNLYATYKIKMQESLSSERKGKTLVDLYGEEKAASIKANMKTRKTRGKMSIEEKQLMSIAMKERSKTSPWKRYLETNSFDLKKCEVCFMEISPSNYSQHHGANCKRKNITCPTCNNIFSTVPWENKKYCCKMCSNSRKSGIKVHL